MRETRSAKRNLSFPTTTIIRVLETSSSSQCLKPATSVLAHTPTRTCTHTRTHKHTTQTHTHTQTYKCTDVHISAFRHPHAHAHKQKCKSFKHSLAHKRTYKETCIRTRENTPMVVGVRGQWSKSKGTKSKSRKLKGRKE